MSLLRIPPGWDRAEVNEEPTPGAACCGVGGGIDRPLRGMTWVYTRATLRRFDRKAGPGVKMTH